MPIRVGLNHVTTYKYDRPVTLGPHVIRLRPAAHCRTPVTAYSLRVEPDDYFINWQQDPHANFLARLNFREPARQLRVEVDLIAEMTVINPFEFFVEEQAEEFPFQYDDGLAKDLLPFLERDESGPLLSEYLKGIDLTPRRTIDFLVGFNQQLQQDIRYVIRMEPGVQSCETTLEKRSGSCRDSAWLMVQVCRGLGLAARFVSGYLIQLTSDVQPLDGPGGPDEDFTDLHAWTEVYLPGAGWVGLDPTSGLFCGEGHIPLACTPSPQSAAPISGGVDPCEVEFEFNMTVSRVHEDPRVTLPFNDAEWSRIVKLGDKVDQRLEEDDVRLTMGGEPTFVSIDAPESPEWTSEAVGPQKQQLSAQLIYRLRDRFAPVGGLLHFGQGKWYPGEPLPRWAYTCLWRKDGEPIWSNPDLLADIRTSYDHSEVTASQFISELAGRLEVDDQHVIAAYENAYHVMEIERKMPVDVDPTKCNVDDPEERQRLASILERGIKRPTGYVLPLTRAWWQANARWVSGAWPLRTAELLLIPGDSPLGLRLPVDSLPEDGAGERGRSFALDPYTSRPSLPGYAEIRHAVQRSLEASVVEAAIEHQLRNGGLGEAEEPEDQAKRTPPNVGPIVNTALCIEPRNGRLHVFTPPTGTLEDYLELIARIEQTATALNTPVVIEGYLPPPDHRVQQLKVTPDPGVIEVNVHPASDWRELVDITTGLYDDARHCRLGTEKFQSDGRHTGTGGGNHIVLGGASPADSPLLRRPDLLKSLVGYWNNHPSLSYLFSGLFVGPTSQAPRADEGRCDTIYELELAFRQTPSPAPRSKPLPAARQAAAQTQKSLPETPPWLVDRLYRNLLVDLTGNTHRAEFCIDKLYSPDSSTGRLGLLEFRGFEMPPHPQMSLVQQLLVRAMVSRFWRVPYEGKLVRWGTTLYDRFMLPHFVASDFNEVIEEMNLAGFEFDPGWFKTHFEFRFPRIGEASFGNMQLELRQAIEPWHVLGEEPGGGGTTRFVDSSLERMQVKVKGFDVSRYAVAAHGRALPLQPTGVAGEYVAGLRYRAWQPPRCLHPTIGVHTPVVVDIVDRVESRSIGGVTYHVEHPGGVNNPLLPVNAVEAESRRAARFTPMGHTPGTILASTGLPDPSAPHTLDLRRALLDPQ